MPTDSVFTVGKDASMNDSTQEYVAYLFAHDDSDEGMIQCGSYTGNQTAGKQIDLGFEPQFVLIKASSGTGNWYMFDTMRGIVTGGFDPFLRANMSAVESGAYEQLEVNPTGFSLSADTNVNTNGVDYIYMAVRRPNKPAEEFEPEELFAVDTMGSAGDGKPPAFRSPLPIDMAIRSDTGGASHEIASRLNAGKWLYTDQTAAESSTTNYADFDFQNGWSNSGTTASNYVSHMWRRAPGFFDVVTYEGNGQAGREVPHSLGVAPEMMWIKVRDRSNPWPVYNKDLGNNGLLYLNTDAKVDTSDRWYYTTPTESVFTLHSDVDVNRGSSPYIAYLFASVPGISDIGTYTGNGGVQIIYCGFDDTSQSVV